MDTLRCMQAFVAVVEHGSFNAAAEHMAVSSVMVGKYIQQLEAHLGVCLLQRNTRRQSLTDAGRNYLAGCRTVLEQVQQAEASVEGLQAQPQGTRMSLVALRRMLQEQSDVEVAVADLTDAVR
ncbi:MAG: LysR family transcriptional regulator, partial [Stenotrophomonas sp.]